MAHNFDRPRAYDVVLGSQTPTPVGAAVLGGIAGVKRRLNRIRLWHLRTGTQMHILEGHNNAVATVAINPDGDKIVSSSWDKTIRVWGVRGL